MVRSLFEKEGFYAHVFNEGRLDGGAGTISSTNGTGCLQLDDWLWLEFFLLLLLVVDPGPGGGG
jgi:hypothetical protein